MGLGLIGAAMAGGLAGLGAGGAKAAEGYGEYLSRSTLEKERAGVQRLRDERMAELETARETAREGRAKAERLELGEAVKKARSGPVDDLSGTVREKTRAEQLLAERDVYAERGEVDKSMRAEQLIQSDEERRERRLDRSADNQRAGRQLDITEKHHKAIEAIQRATEGRLAKGAELDRSIKEIALENAKRVKALEEEFRTATPERKKAIIEEKQLLTGKDNDNYLPVPLKDDQGNVTGYKVFDKKRGEWVEPRPSGAGATPTQAHVDALKARAKDPKAVAAFDAQYGEGAARRILDDTKKDDKPRVDSASQAPIDYRPMDSGGGESIVTGLGRAAAGMRESMRRSEEPRRKEYLRSQALAGVLTANEQEEARRLGVIK